MAGLKSWRERARALKREVLVLYFAVRDPRTPLIAKVIAAAVVAYALSPIDLIPDFIPILGLLDDVILVPLGIALCLKLIPAPILADARSRAAALARKPRSYAAAALIVLVWLAIAGALLWWVYRLTTEAY
jgi:uncharacterized membrane protein YkvA (DUF1232 family)